MGGDMTEVGTRPAEAIGNGSRTDRHPKGVEIIEFGPRWTGEEQITNSSPPDLLVIAGEPQAESQSRWCRLMDLSAYPKYLPLKSGMEIELRPLETGDSEILLAFFQRLSIEDRRYLRYDVTNPRVIEKWLAKIDPDRTLELLALMGTQVIGTATLIQNPHSWTSHVGSVRLVIDQTYRRQGLGLMLAREIFRLALQNRIEKVQAEIVVGQTAALRIFQKLGFECEAALKDHIKDLVGRKHDMLIMTHDLTASWVRLQEAIQESMVKAGV